MAKSNKKQDLTWKLTAAAATFASGYVADKVVSLSWRAVTGRPAPNDQTKLATYAVAELAAFAIISGAVLTLTRELTLRSRLVRGAQPAQADRSLTLAGRAGNKACLAGPGPLGPGPLARQLLDPASAWGASGAGGDAGKAAGGSVSPAWQVSLARLALPDQLWALRLAEPKRAALATPGGGLS